MKIKRNLTLIWLLCAAMLPAVAQAQLAFITNTNNTLTVTGYTGPPWTVTIPATNNSLPVTSIGAKAFFDCTSLTSITIPNSVTNIGDYAFIYCSSLANVTIPNSVTSIGNKAFYDCMGLTNVTIPNGITNIGDLAFGYCTSLLNVTIPSSISSIGTAVFGCCSSLTNFTIGNSVKSIGDSAFQDCTSLTSVIIPTSVTSIGNYAFESCPKLTSVTVPNSVTSIWNYAFVYCYGLTNVTIGSSVTHIGDYAFLRCSNLTKAYFLGNAPSGTTTIFSGESGTAYYLPGTIGWTNTFGGWPTALWYQPKPMILGRGYGLGATTNGFAFTISWATNIPVVVEACADLANGNWCPVATNTLTSGTNYFNDCNWTNYPSRFYRIRSP